MSLTRGLARTVRSSSLLAAALVFSFAACGLDVDLGGTSDAGAPEAATPVEDLVDLCEPCAASPSCPVGATCATVSGNHAFCVTLCPRGTECDADDVCQLASIAVTLEAVRVCTPKVGACEPPRSPTIDGAALVRCGTLDGPTIAAACRSCDKDDRNCQKNGCYGGWWCNAATKRCQKPPASCP